MFLRPGLKCMYSLMHVISNTKLSSVVTFKLMCEILSNTTFFVMLDRIYMYIFLKKKRDIFCP